ncbi:DUF2070 family protein [Stygiolobus caldivivus]|uniref:DUF2070 domain-containing protein n=1 Tax=Stygiolobus caldivivus TaxID=2824673 RepID=A0A8D5U4Y2_9CREN|nr:DUF2070 family protein [Stygiolobus caldivivus]BCU68991.1 hypothetical protein KN1_02880 [Stygiolobus caldivivus]
MNSEAITRKYYSKIKSLPNIKVISGISVLETGLVYLRSLTIGIDYFISLILYFSVMLLLLRDLKVTLFFLDLTAFTYLVFSFLTKEVFFSFGIFAPLAGYGSLASNSELRATGIIFLSTFVPSLAYGFRPITLAYSLLISSVFYVYIYLLNRKGERLTGFKSMQIVRPFIMGVVRKDYEALEKFLDNLGIKTNLRIGIFKVSDHFLVLPKIHFGLSGEIGSSKFPYYLESLNPKNIIFHGPGSHEIDITSSKKTMEIAKLAFSEELNDSNWKDQLFYGIYAWKSKCNFRGITLLFSKSTLTFVERPGKGIDDLPLRLWDYITKESDYVVDCHNEYLTEELPKQTDKCIIEEIEAIKKQRENATPKPFLISFKEGQVKACEGLCKKTIRVVVISDGEKKIGIIYLYANNSDPSLTNAIRDRLSKVVDIPLLVTPDDHTCTASSMRDLYLPAQYCDELVHLAEDLVKEAVSDLKESSLSIKELDVKGVKVVGKIVSNFVVALEEVGNYTMRTFWIPLVSPLILAIIFILVTDGVIKF